MNYGLHGFPKGRRITGVPWRLQFPPIPLYLLNFVDIPIPRGTHDILLSSGDVSVATAANYAYIRLGSNRLISASGYLGSSTLLNNTPTITTTTTATEMPIGYVALGANQTQFVARVSRINPDGNLWVCNGSSNTNYTGFDSALFTSYKDMPGPVDVLRFGTAAPYFDAGYLHVTMEGVK